MGCFPQIEKLGTVDKGEVGSRCWVVQPLEKEMATHSSVLAWRVLGMGEPGGRLWGRTELDTTEAT